MARSLYICRCVFKAYDVDVEIEPAMADKDYHLTHLNDRDGTPYI